MRFEAGRRWTSARVEGDATRSNGPSTTPVGRYAVKALLDSQELDSRASTGAIYWEGLSDLFDASGQRVGGGYLEMTGYASALTL